VEWGEAFWAALAWVDAGKAMSERGPDAAVAVAAAVVDDGFDKLASRGDAGSAAPDTPRGRVMLGR
jgi:hypothetical protein